jgi:hypothetical protein
LGEIDDGHPTATDFALDGVAMSEGSLQTFDEAFHRTQPHVRRPLEYGSMRGAASVERGGDYS